MTGHFAKGTAVQVQLRNEEGKAVLDFKGIPVDQVGKLIEALMAQLPPGPQVRLVEKAPPSA